MPGREGLVLAEMPQLREELPLHGAAGVKTSAPLTAATSEQQGGSCNGLSPSGEDPVTFGDHPPLE